MNDARVAGKLNYLKLDHEINGERIYSGTITTLRSSGTPDNIPVLIPEFLLPKEECVSIIGEFRSHNTEDRKLKLYLYAQWIEEYTEDKNDIQLEGYICKTPVYRTTPSGKKITDILIAVPRSNMYDRSDYLPIIKWGDPDPNYAIGDKLQITGRIQSREHRKGVAYEVSAKTIDKIHF